MAFTKQVDVVPLRSVNNLTVAVGVCVYALHVALLYATHPVAVKMMAPFSHHKMSINGLRLQRATFNQTQPVYFQISSSNGVPGVVHRSHNTLFNWCNGNTSH